MSQLLIDREKCQKDGLCVAECPLGIIALEEAEGFPAYIPGTQEFCVTCGHCVAGKIKTTRFGGVRRKFSMNWV